MDHETLITDIENRAGHRRTVVDLEGEYTGSVPNEEAAKYSHNNQELGGDTLQR
jgi:hypothetical protein